MGASCTETIPRLSPGQGCCILICCILLSGWGTIYAACMADRYEYLQVCIGFAQLFIPIGGYIWAIIWGIKIYDKSQQPGTTLLPSFSQNSYNTQNPPFAQNYPNAQSPPYAPNYQNQNYPRPPIQ